jgi:murein DD-endopeptidase MepM/ murein hydrolase activator NlpD
LPFAVFLFACWAGLTCWALLVSSRNLDYYATKADNRILQTRMAYVAREMEQGRRSLAVTQKTAEDMRKMLGMGSKDAIIKDANGIGGADPRDALTFRKVLAKKASEISESVFHQGIEQVNSESKDALASFQEIAWYIANQRNTYRSTPSIWPAQGRLASPFGYRMSPFGGESGEFHSGLDISNKLNTPIYATADGVVRHAGWAAGYGNAVLIDHGSGYSTLYGHTAEVKVREGQRVSRGQLIARMGSTGRSTGCHVHYEVWVNGKPVDPLKYLNGAGGKAALRNGQEED